MNRVMGEHRVFYYESGTEFEEKHFGRELADMIRQVKYEKRKKSVLFLCIGSDRSTGDSLGPLTGYLLKQKDGLLEATGMAVVGTLSLPVHAVNLEAVIGVIEAEFSDCVIVAVDASVGARKNVGCITLAEGGLKPGYGVNKNLREVGDISITGIVSWGSRLEPILLQNIRLGLVMNMASCITVGILQAALECQREVVHELQPI